MLGNLPRAYFRVGTSLAECGARIDPPLFFDMGVGGGGGLQKWSESEKRPHTDKLRLIHTADGCASLSHHRNGPWKDDPGNTNHGMFFGFSFWDVPPTFGCGSQLNRRGYAGFGPWFHLPGFHFCTGFLSHSHLVFRKVNTFAQKGPCLVEI